MEKKYLDYVMEQTQKLIAIPSPTGYNQQVQAYLREELGRLGYPETTGPRRGGVAVHLGGEGNPVTLTAHCDTLGAVVRWIKPEGTLMISPIGGLNPNNVETSNVTVITKFSGEYSGTIQIENASSHVNAHVNDPRSFDENIEVVLDELVKTDEEVRKLGIEVGDFIALDPRTVVTPSGFIKSRFLDDKLCAAILLGYAKYVKEEKIALNRAVWLHFSVYEEIGTGGATLFPAEAHDIIAVDMGCVGEFQTGRETKVSICAKDSKGPYHYELLKEVVKAGMKEQVDYAVDTYYRYGSDVEGSLSAGYDARHLTIGPGVYASHGYERSHQQGVAATFDLIRAYLAE
ncbi:M42 family metallopeptidase [Acidaminobacterium chupaoyuni]